MHGKGALTSLDGTVYKGTFENGTLAGDCIVSNPNKGFSVHANFLNDFKDGKIAVCLLVNEELALVLLSLCVCFYVLITVVMIIFFLSD